MLKPLWLLLAGYSHPELVRTIEFLKAENRILRSKLPRQVVVTPKERRRLVELGKKLGAAVKELIPIVSYRTFQRWLVGSQVKGFLGNTHPTV